jgi:hypothetical protein
MVGFVRNLQRHVKQFLAATPTARRRDSAPLLGTLSAALSPNIYVTGRGRSTNGVLPKRSRPVVTVVRFATA